MSRQENSFGIIPLRREEAKWQILLIQHNRGHWAFPKGHADGQETFKQTAERELTEETGLKVEHYLSLDSLTETYYFFFEGKRIHKTVLYFPALVSGTIKIQESEIKACQWLDLAEAEKQITFKEGKRICKQVKEELILDK